MTVEEAEGDGAEVGAAYAEAAHASEAATTDTSKRVANSRDERAARVV